LMKNLRPEISQIKKPDDDPFFQIILAYKGKYLFPLLPYCATDDGFDIIG
jgi:hypothetical protein